MATSNSKKKDIKGYMPKILSAALILTGVLYIAAVSHLYFTGGDTPYSRERVGSYLIWLAIPSLITVILAAAAAVISIRSDKPENEGSPEVEIFKQKASLAKLTASFDHQNAPASVKSKIKCCRDLRRDSLISAAIVSILTLIPAFITLLNTDSFTIDNLNSDIALAVVTVVFNALIAAMAWGSYVFTSAAAVSDEIAVIKEAVRNNSALYKKPSAKEGCESSKWIMLSIRGGAVAVAIALIVLGALNGGMADVLGKAVKICTECIGLG